MDFADERIDCTESYDLRIFQNVISPQDRQLFADVTWNLREDITSLEITFPNWCADVVQWD